MLVFRNYKLLSIILHVIRLITFAVLGLQIFFYRKSGNASDDLVWIISIYPAAWTCQIAYHLFSIWVSISVRYWIIVLGTK